MHVSRPGQLSGLWSHTTLERLDDILHVLKSPSASTPTRPRRPQKECVVRYTSAKEAIHEHLICMKTSNVRNLLLAQPESTYSTL